MVSFPDAIKMFFARYTDFQGRSRRSEYWWVVLFNLIIGVVGGFLIGLTSGAGLETGDLSPVSMILIGILGLYVLAIIIPSIALFVRRLHDINQTGWIYLGLIIAGLIPLLNLIAAVAQIVIALIPGTAGPNKYGPDPKDPAGSASDVFV